LPNLALNEPLNGVQERIMALTTRLELSRQALTGLQDKKGHRVVGIVGALEAVREQVGRGPSDQLEDSFALAFRVADLEALQQSLLEKENNELRELYGELVSLHERQQYSLSQAAGNGNGAADPHAQSRIADLEDRLRGQAEALNAKSSTLDQMRREHAQQMDEQKSRVAELLQNLKLMMREKEAAEAAARQAREESARTIAPSERDHWQSEVTRLAERVDALQGELDVHRHEAQGSDNRLAHLLLDYKTCQEEKAQLEHQVEQYRRELAGGARHGQVCC
jgi:chromosome segregation ATPase